MGKWQVFDSSSIYPSTQYPITTGADTVITSIYITNFYNFFTDTVHAIIERDSIIIPVQICHGYRINGTGYFDYDITSQVTLVYDVNNLASGMLDHRMETWHLLP